MQGAPSSAAVVVPFDDKQKVEDVLKALCGRLSLDGRGDNTKEGLELRLASNNCLLIPSDLACTVLSDGDYVVVGEYTAATLHSASYYVYVYMYTYMDRGWHVYKCTYVGQGSQEKMLNPVGSSYTHLHPVMRDIRVSP